MKFTKLYITALFALFFVGCSAGSHSNKSANIDNAKIEKNKQIAVLNEVGKIVRDIQAAEKLGRNMDSYRIGLDAKSKNICNTVMEENRRELPDLESRVKNLPENYRDRLTPIFSDLTECVSCTKDALASCVKTRASTNDIIKELYP